VCGIFGVYGVKQASYLSFLGLYGLQHRGQESAGIVSFDGKKIHSHVSMGLVNKVFNEKALDKLPGQMAIGHVRYSTTGSSSLKNAQPLLVNYAHGDIAVGHNGNLVNAGILRDELEAHGSIFQTNTDTEIIIHLLAQQSKSVFLEGLMDTLSKLRGAYSLVFLREDEIIAVRDPRGFRPLSLAKKDNGYIISSETCAFDLIEAEFVRDLEPGEVLVINKNGLQSYVLPEEPANYSTCIFELIYFSRPDSNVFSESVHKFRERLGQTLAREYPVEADLVIPVPDSGNSAAFGYSEASGIPLEQGMIRNHYIGRTFIQPEKKIRDLRVRIKLNPIRDVIEGKRIVVVDDSIVRGTTSKARINSLKEAGAKEIHLRVSCPPHKFGCYYGIDFPDPRELIANKKSVNSIKQFLGVDSLGYLSVEGMLSCSGGNQDDFCKACFCGDYSVVPRIRMNKFGLEK